MRIKYTYKEYKDFPEATEISKGREQRKVNLELLLPFEIIGTICIIATTVMSRHPLLILLSILMVLSIVHSVYALKHYDKRTEDKINKAINDTIKEKIELKEYLADSKYHCKSILRKNEYRKGKCLICNNQCENLEKCKIKNVVGTREIFICNDCITKYEASCKK